MVDMVGMWLPTALELLIIGIVLATGVGALIFVLSRRRPPDEPS